MLVSHRHRFIYTKTVKTGGTSVEIYFEEACLPQGASYAPRQLIEETITPAGIIGLRGRAAARPRIWYNHMPAIAIRELVGERIWREYFKFCCIRNPFDKAVSLFWFAMPPEKRKYYAVAPFAETKADFSHWLRANAEGLIDRDRYFIDGAVCVDFFVRYEALLQDLESVCREIDYPFAPDRLGRYKSEYRAVDKPASHYFDHASAALVEKIFHWEIAHFEYARPASS